MNLIDGDKYHREFVKLLTELNEKRQSKKNYNRITEKMCFLVGKMIGHIDALQLGITPYVQKVPKEDLE